ncbi:23S rRNA (adenine(2503)-C(2))-methyltransferase RlmN [bacterium]|nr:MAG: 23S rRNA (adenine(2503)-C(2))-methyltransferase RlmN [bacterium]
MSPVTPMNLLGQNTSELENTLRSMDESAFRGRQISEWIYKKGATSFDDMKNIGGPLRAKLVAEHELTFPPIVARSQSDDGTTKLLLEMHDGERIETVRLPYPDRLSVCISSQAGCAMACQFCATGLGGFRRNLSAAEIVSQILLCKNEDSGSHLKTPTHVVFMGMGEPLLNFQNVLKSIHLMHDEIGVPMRQITLSTVGVLPGIEKLAAEKLQLTLAISLHAPTDELRHRLIPTSTKTSVVDIVTAARNYVKTTGRRVTFEYVVLGGVNDSSELAKQLAKLCKGWPCHVNLIPWNSVAGASLDGLGFGSPDPIQLRRFKNILEEAGIATTQRVQRGADVAAACGQLRALKQEPRFESSIPLAVG